MSSTSSHSHNIPEASIRALQRECFLPIPNTDPLVPLLGKHIPSELRPQRQDTPKGWANQIEADLISSNSWRTLARKTEDAIGTAEDVGIILNLWCLRLCSLARMRLYNQATAECQNIWNALHLDRPQNVLLNPLIPFDLVIFRVRTQFWANDHYTYLDELSALHASCLRISSRSNHDERSSWRERGARLGLLLAVQLAEFEDFKGAQKVLVGLINVNTGISADLYSVIGRMCLVPGDLPTAARYFAVAKKVPGTSERMDVINKALLDAARGSWATALLASNELFSEFPEDLVLSNVIAVALLHLGRLTESINMLELSVQSFPSAFVMAEPLIFNLATLYELQAATAIDRKRQLLIEVAKWSGDGVRTGSLKLS